MAVLCDGSVQFSPEYSYFILITEYLLFKILFSGKARMGVFAAAGDARTMDFQAGDVGYVNRSFPHYIENTGKEDVIFLEIFPNPYYEDISLGAWLAHTPPVIVNEHIRTGQAFIDSIDEIEAVVLP